MTEKPNPGGLPATRKKYTPAFKVECVRQVAAGARQTDVARAQGISPALLGRWQRSALLDMAASKTWRCQRPSRAGEYPRHRPRRFAGHRPLLGGRTRP